MAMILRIASLAFGLAGNTGSAVRAWHALPALLV
jgi:hypothetical protein